jgi:membrane-bound metal-dependent hydrolase YbcI (DUF457 family)
MGAMAPDFEFFLRLTDERLIAHTILGVFIFCLPLGLAGLFLFHRFLKYPLIALLPHDHQTRLYRAATRFRFLPARRFITIVLALLIGIFSHIAWDAWTHQNGWFAPLFPILDENLFRLGTRWQQLHDILGYLSSAGGLVVLYFAYRNWYHRAPVSEYFRPMRVSTPVRLAIGALIFCVSIAGGLTHGLTTNPPDAALKPFIAATLVATVSAFLAAWALYSLIWHAIGHEEQQAPSS